MLSSSRELRKTFLFFYLCIHPPDSQESDGDANT